MHKICVKTCRYSVQSQRYFRLFLTIRPRPEFYRNVCYRKVRYFSTSRESRLSPARPHQTAMCSTKTAYVTLNLALQRMGNNQHELLRVLDKPYLPLHNNLSERDIRDYVKKRKISGSTRSEAGRRCRDTFASLKKTCLKHKISFWHYLKDRLLGESNIPPLPDLVRAAATCG